MAEADVEPVFKTKRQRLLGEVLIELGLALVCWLLFLREAPDVYGGVFLAASSAVGALAMVGRARELIRWPEHRRWEMLASGGFAVAVILGLRLAEYETAWTIIGLSAGAVTARLLLYATGEWRPGDPR